MTQYVISKVPKILCYILNFLLLIHLIMKVIKMMFSTWTTCSRKPPSILKVWLLLLQMVCNGPRALKIAIKTRSIILRYEVLSYTQESETVLCFSYDSLPVPNNLRVRLTVFLETWHHSSICTSFFRESVHVILNIALFIV